MAKTATTKFAPDEIAIANDGYLCFVGGQEVLLKLGSRHLGSEPVVIERPELFVKDGEPVVPPERPEPPEEPLPPPRPKPAMLRVKKNVSLETREIPGAYGVAEKFRLRLSAGSLIKADFPYLVALTPKERREYLEEVPPE